ncbi:MAG: phosphoribosylamine--glycine ligase [Hyphomicrobiales bacterium]|nr:MAG: phosphoribosylamine--glycine ligase [Hyphomicrobiales bacterium]
MKILIVGGGGREHALAWKLAQDSSRPEVYCAPGNAGTAACALNLDIGAEDVPGLLAWACAERPDLTVVGPEAPLCAGIADAFMENGLSIFGPSREAARLEGSKAFAKEIMTAAGVPTAVSRTFTDASAAMGYVRSLGAPIVVKADGLAAGKGVAVCATVEEAEAAVRASLVDRVFGAAGGQVVVEECLQGEEASILALVDGKSFLMLASSQDHKRVRDGDQGPNTGGMGAYSPAPVVTDELWPVIARDVIGRTLDELRRRGIVYRGVLYAGIMLTPAGVRVLEFNCRFGDPETQAILPRIEGDLLPALRACVDGTLTQDAIRWKRQACVCVVMAASGYPGPYAKGLPIAGLDAAAHASGAVVFHAGTALHGGRVTTSGGRVLGVPALGDDLKTACDAAYAAAGEIRFDGAHYRRDIAARAFGRSQ